MNSNWPRWIFASVSYYMSTVAASIPLPLLVEGIDDREPENMEVDHAELRVTGPFITEISRNYYRLLVDVNVLLTDLMGAKENAYDLIQWGGVFQEAMQGPINIYKYGNDDSYLGCLSLRDRRGENIKLFHFGQLGKSERVRQSVVDGRYVTYLEG